MAVPPLLLFGTLTALLTVPSTARPAAVNASAAPSGVEVRVGVLLPEHNLDYPWAWPRVAPALRLALEALEPQLRHAGLAVRTAFASTENEDGACDHLVAKFQAADLKSSHDPDVLLGLGCPQTNYFVGPFAQHGQLPLIRAGAYRREKDSSTTVYAGPVGPDLRAFQDQVHRLLNWTSRSARVVSPESDYWDYALLTLEEYAPYSVAHRHSHDQPGQAVRFIQTNGPVVYIFGSLEMLQEIMLLAEAHNMTNCDYIFIYMDILGESLKSEGHCKAAKPWQSKESQDTRGLREAFQPGPFLRRSWPTAWGGAALKGTECGPEDARNPSRVTPELIRSPVGDDPDCPTWQQALFASAPYAMLPDGPVEVMLLVVTSHEPQTPEYQRFQSQVILRAQRDFGVALNDSLGTLVAGCFHDVLLLYLRALNETLREGGTKRDTSRILEKMRGLKIQGVTGTVSINSDNERETDFDLWAMRDVESGEYQVVAHYVGSEKQVKWLGPIPWMKGGPPLDNLTRVFDMNDPSCGQGVDFGQFLNGGFPQLSQFDTFVFTARCWANPDLQVNHG
ncbi:UNVERIFIED_CONTAM: hypothetical protein K2H54_021026 [Gekko kuhli]